MKALSCLFFSLGVVFFIKANSTSDYQFVTPLSVPLLRVAAKHSSDLPAHTTQKSDETTPPAIHFSRFIQYSVPFLLVTCLILHYILTDKHATTMLIAFLASQPKPLRKPSFLTQSTTHAVTIHPNSNQNSSGGVSLTEHDLIQIEKKASLLNPPSGHLSLEPVESLRTILSQHFPEITRLWQNSTNNSLQNNNFQVDFSAEENTFFEWDYLGSSPTENQPERLEPIFSFSCGSSLKSNFIVELVLESLRKTAPFYDSYEIQLLLQKTIESLQEASQKLTQEIATASQEENPDNEPPNLAFSSSMKDPLSDNNIESTKKLLEGDNKNDIDLLSDLEV